MKPLRFALALAAMFAVLACISTQADAQKKKKKRGKAAIGRLLKVDDNAITIKTRGNKKKKIEGKELTFKLTKDTKVLKATGKKKEPPTEAAVADLKAGLIVAVITAKDSDVAQRILIFKGGKKKKKKNQ